MSEISILAIFILSIALIISIFRFVTANEIYTKILVVNLIGTKIVLLILLVGTVSIEKDFTDIALVYALINFISTIVILKYYEDKEATK
ncbi:MAG: pH regulation protein F [Gammaproteobacteria bacterium]|jgi:multicomponent Na+:H+ antiporter subunit F|nr:pH regulation protein F [Gammaproteobacteria bacterium]MBT5644178.1 pH regulation protein F [Gammaproteobacteria bacterium]MBT5863832.1 pH regulation protein F [Gammaproteobacteria bacterium]MBT7236291.1 pH regulation protein F [Gammaproteobacteria bacterium]|tara:strand:- start:182 stop:448 length:267 start_codon:yes stop_codon:yes gene_type:complete